MEYSSLRWSGISVSKGYSEFITLAVKTGVDRRSGTLYVSYVAITVCLLIWHPLANGLAKRTGTVPVWGAD